MRCGVIDSQVRHSWKMLRMATWREHRSEPENLGLPFPYLLLAQPPAGSFHLIFMYFYNEKKEPNAWLEGFWWPHSQQFAYHTSDLNGRRSVSRSEKRCRSPRRDAAHALLIGRWHLALVADQSSNVRKLPCRKPWPQVVNDQQAVSKIKAHVDDRRTREDSSRAPSTYRGNNMYLQSATCSRYRIAV